MARYNGPTPKLCWKTPHKTAQKARKAQHAAASNSKRNGRKNVMAKHFRKDENKRKTNVYFCKICDAWHWGHLRD